MVPSANQASLSLRMNFLSLSEKRRDLHAIGLHPSRKFENNLTGGTLRVDFCSTSADLFAFGVDFSYISTDKYRGMK